MYGVAETLANRIPTLEEFIGATPAVAIVPFFFAGSLFPITAMPGGPDRPGARPPAHPRHGADALRVARQQRRTARHLGQADPTVMASLSMAVVALFAASLMLVAVRAFKRSAVQ